MAYVEIKKVRKTFRTRTGDPFHALKDVDLQLVEGEFVSVIGHSGCGKSTLLNLVAGLTKVSAGTIAVKGELVTGPGPSRMVAFQNHSLLPWLTLRQNIQLAVDTVHTSKSKEERSQMVSEYLEMVKLTPAADRLPSQVSGGMKQRCGIARALSTQPKVLLLDEPFGALDALTRANLQDELMRIWEAQRVTVMMITHEVEEALLLSDRIVMMSNGPEAKVAEIMKVDLPRPRKRLEVIEHPSYYRQRSELLYFLNKCKRAKQNNATKPKPAAAGRVSSHGLEKEELVVGFVPLLDCAPFAAAEREKIFEDNHLKVTLSREPSWRAISDGLREGRLDAAQMVTGMPFAETLGLGGRPAFATATAMTLSRGGNAITFGSRLLDAGVKDAESLHGYVQELKKEGRRSTFGMVHPASMHNLLLRAWLSAANIDPDKDLNLVVIPPPQMVANLLQGSIAGYCVGEPWNIRAVRKGLGAVAATDEDIWPRHPEKVLGVSQEWAAAHPKTHLALVKSLLKSCALCDDPKYRKDVLPELLATRAFVGGTPDEIAACLTGPYEFSAGDRRPLPELVQFSEGLGNLCHKNETMWVLTQMVRWGLTPFPKDADELLAQIYLEDVIREAAETLNKPMEGHNVGILEFSGMPSFDPSAPREYLMAFGVALDAAEETKKSTAAA